MRLVSLHRQVRLVIADNFYVIEIGCVARLAILAGVAVACGERSQTSRWKFHESRTTDGERLRCNICCVVGRSYLIDLYAAVKTKLAAMSDMPQSRTLLLELFSSSLAIMSVPLLAMDS